ncbi:MAG: hypothetical protein ACRCXZ_07285 [Patescibacteria group bacterium]
MSTNDQLKLKDGFIIIHLFIENIGGDYKLSFFGSKKMIDIDLDETFQFFSMKEALKYAIEFKTKIQSMTHRVDCQKSGLVKQQALVVIE